MASSASSSSLLRSSLRAVARQGSSTSAAASSSSSSSSRHHPRTFTSTTSSPAALTEGQNTTTTTPPLSPSRKKSNNVRVSLLLSRQPLILRSPTPLESAYFEYNHALTRRLSQPFVKDFYFRKGSAAETKFDAEESHRRSHLDFPATSSSSSSKKDVEGKGKGKGQAADAPAVGDTATATNPDAELYATVPRKTPADESNDTTSLERALDRCLFLLFKDPATGQWRLPERGVDLNKKETLHRVATLPVKEALGAKLDIWLVSHLPIGVMPRPVEGQNGAGSEKVSSRARVSRRRQPWSQTPNEDTDVDPPSADLLPPSPSRVRLTKGRRGKRVRLAHKGRDRGEAGQWRLKGVL